MRPSLMYLSNCASFTGINFSIDLHFYDDSIFDYEIKAITAIQANAFVRNRKGNLSPEIQSPALNLPAKSFFINCFE
jgi:hypothetical protein